MYIANRARRLNRSVSEYCDVISRGALDPALLLNETGMLIGIYSKNLGNNPKAVRRKDMLANDYSIGDSEKETLRTEIKRLLPDKQDKTLSIRVVGPNANCYEIITLLEIIRDTAPDGIMAWSIHFEIFDFDFRVLTAAKRLLKQKKDEAGINVTWNIFFGDVESTECLEYIYDRERKTDITIRRNIPLVELNNESAILESTRSIVFVQQYSQRMPTIWVKSYGSSARQSGTAVVILPADKHKLLLAISQSA